MCAAADQIEPGKVCRMGWRKTVGACIR